jgi:hypothetical protein
MSADAHVREPPRAGVDVARADAERRPVAEPRVTVDRESVAGGPRTSSRSRSRCPSPGVGLEVQAASAIADATASRATRTSGCAPI